MIRRAALPAMFIFVMFFGMTRSGACFIMQDTARLKVIRNIPIIKGTINGITAHFLVDTGSTITVLNESLQDHYGFSVAKNRFWNKRCVIGMGGRCFLKEVHDVTVGLGGMHLEFVNKSSDLTMLSEQFAAHGIAIAGIIGTDLLCFLGANIDLKTQVITFNTDTRPILNVTAFVKD
jgi:hypothetical protein